MVYYGRNQGIKFLPAVPFSFPRNTISWPGPCLILNELLALKLIIRFCGMYNSWSTLK